MGGAKLSGGPEIIYSSVIDRSILARLKEHEAELRRRGVARMALFGSGARRGVGDNHLTFMAREGGPSMNTLGGFERALTCAKGKIRGWAAPCFRRDRPRGHDG